MAALLTTGSAQAAKGDYYTSPTSPGRHYSCENAYPGKVAYENSDVILLCDDLKLSSKKGFLRTMNYWSFAPDKAFVKVPEGTQLAEGEAMAKVKAQFTEPFYDSAEKRMVRIKGVAVALDALTTGVGIGNCSEAGPAKHIPVLGLAIGVGDVLYFRHISKESPRFYTMSKEKIEYAPAITHGGAAISNLARCVF